MNKVAVIFDTNACHSRRETQNFFGERTRMREIGSRADILIPKIVIDEILQQNIEGTEQNLESLKRNSLFTALGFERDKLDSLKSTDHAQEIYAKEDIRHIVVDIKDRETAFRKIETLAIKGSAPFNERNIDGKNNSDKGVKDALFVCTSDEILADSKYDTYYMACHDGRIKDYYRDNKRIVCLPPEEVLEELKKTFFDEYTLDRTKEELGWPTLVLTNDWININSDIVGLFTYEEYLTAVIFDKNSKEILESNDYLFIEDCNLLNLSSSYSMTHETVSKIISGIAYYDYDQIQTIRTGLTTNDQVYGIGKDDDINELAKLIFDYISYDLSSLEVQIFDDYYNIRIK